MKKYIKNYLNFFNIGEQDIVLCQVCTAPATDLHHIKYRSQGGSDEVDNLILLDRSCHDRAHFKKKPYLTAEELKQFQKNNPI